MRSQKEYRILIIEDNQADAALIRIYLGEVKLPAVLFEASKLESGIQMAAQQAFDLVLLDLTLPDSDRFHTLRRFLEEIPDLPVIVMTGYNDEMIGIQSVRAGAQDFLVKEELNGKTLSKSIKYALQRFGRQNKLQQTAKALSNHQEHYRAVHQMAKMGNWDLDIVSYTMKWTDEMFHILGIPPRGFQPTLTDYLDLVHVEDRPQVEAFFARAVQDTEVHRIQHRIVIHNRSLKYIALQARIKYDKLHENILLIGSIQDITEHRPEPGGLPVTDKDVLTSQFQQKTLRQIAQTQLKHLQFIADYFLVDQHRHSASVQRSGLLQLAPHFNGLLHTMCQLYNFPPLFSGTFPPVEEKEFSLKKMFQQLNPLTELIRKPDTAIRMHLAANLPDLIIGDEETIQHLFITLFCLTASEPPALSDLDIYVGSRKMEENIATLHLVINCKENIPNTEQLEALIDLDNVWEQLFSVDHDWPVPLAIAGKLTKTLQGIYHFRDMGTKGHQIEMEFPVKTIPSTVTSPERPESPIRLLLVEDHAINQIATRRLLSKWSEKIQIDIAANGEAGLQMFREHPYDIILMDLYMPVMDGLEATRRIRAISKTPIIALTTEASPEEEEKCYAAGMDDYLTKPFQLPDIYPRILKLIRRNER